MRRGGGGGSGAGAGGEGEEPDATPPMLASSREKMRKRVPARAFVQRGQRGSSLQERAGSHPAEILPSN